MDNPPPLVLVTGASGFIAGHIVQQLCIKGYRVRGTVRKISKDHQYIYDLSTDKNTRPIELFECDLSSDKNWDKAIQGCDYVIHTANVIPAKGVTLAEKDYVEPVMKGIKIILNICLENRNTVKKVIYTTSVAAMDAEGKNLPKERQDVTFLTSKDWTQLDRPDYSPSGYMKSKTLAEKFAWDFVKKHNNPFELVSIAPAMTIGPLLNARMPSSMMVVAAIMDRIYPLLPKINWKLCDVRDVAAAHVNALTSKAANGNRYVIINSAMWTSDIATFLNYQYGPQGFSVRQAIGPYWAIWLASFFDPLLTDFVLPQYGKLRLFDSSPAGRDLNIVYNNTRDMLLDAGNSLIHHKLIKIPKSFEQNKARL